MNHYIIDCEVYQNYFLLYAKQHNGEKTFTFEAFDNQSLSQEQINTIGRMMRQTVTQSFNGNGYDLYIIAYALSGATTQQIKKLSDTIIKSQLPPYRIADQYNIRVPNWNHIDIIEVAPGQVSLKLYGARLNSPSIQDLPYPENAKLTREQCEHVKSYCFNDLLETERLFNALAPQIKLREQMGEMYGLDLRSKSDAQIAEAVIKSELEKMTGKQYRKPNVADDATFRYRDPKIITFESEQLKTVFDRILSEHFKLAGNGSMKMPAWLAKTTINIGRSQYQMGIGGLHSCESAQYVQADDDYKLIDADVASYYPSIILQQGLAPATLGEPFLKVYQSIVDRRLKAKKEGDNVTANTLKIVVNGSFGKLGSKYSILYAPDLLIQTTITGQLALLMLIEQLELNGISVVSANTDGIVSRVPVDKLDDYDTICFDWVLQTSYVLEFAQYAKLASRDVNNYVAVTTSGKLKKKGKFAPTGLAKNPDEQIVYDAAAEFVATGAPIEKTIRECTDINKFVKVRKVQGGGQWQGKYLGKTVRYYYSNQVPMTTTIEYVKNGNTVPMSQGARPIMNYGETLPDDIDYERYIVEAEKLLCLMGVK